VTENLAQLYAALAKAQAAMVNPPLDAVNPHYKSRFASLPAVRDAVVPALAANGIAIVQDVRTGDMNVSVTTTLLHESGATLAFGPLVMPVLKLDPQGVGSAITYAKRYALLALACVAGDEDDDANAASSERIDAEQANKLEALLQESGADREAFLRWLGAESLPSVAAKKFDSAVRELEKAAKRIRKAQP